MGKITDFLRKIFGKPEDASEVLIVWEECEPITEPEIVVKPKKEEKPTTKVKETPKAEVVVDEVKVDKKPKKKNQKRKQAKKQ